MLVGLAAIPSSALWAAPGRRWSRPELLLAALAVQVVGIALPALVGGVAAGLISAALFGATFIGVSTLAPRSRRAPAVPPSRGAADRKILGRPDPGPPRRRPLLHHGYHQALVLAAVVVLAAALAAFVLRIGFPHRLPARRHHGTSREPVAEHRLGSPGTGEAQTAE